MSTPFSPLDDILPMNEVNPLKVRSGDSPATKSRISPLALVLDSGANIHIFNNPSFLSGIITCLCRYINTTGSRTLCNKIGRLLSNLKSLHLPMTGFYFQPNGIANISAYLCCLTLTVLSWTQMWKMHSMYSTGRMVPI